jgi:ribosomal-protein-alanine N-acetyltransferase
MANLADITFLLGRRGDAAPIAALSNALIEHGLEAAWTASRVARRIADPETVVLVARAPAAALAGFAIMRFGDVGAHLDLLAVAAPLQRQGLGRRLLRWLEASALTAGTFHVSLELRANNTGARDFYQALGYAMSGHRPGYYQGREDAITMRRDLRVTTA